LSVTGSTDFSRLDVSLARWLKYIGRWSLRVQKSPERTTDVDPALLYYFWLGKEIEERLEQEAFEEDFALRVYTIDGSGAQKKWREMFPASVRK
jgi:hypothetical protein